MIIFDSCWCIFWNFDSISVTIINPIIEDGRICIFMTHENSRLNITKDFIARIKIGNELVRYYLGEGLKKFSTVYIRDSIAFYGFVIFLCWGLHSYYGKSSYFWYNPFDFEKMQIPQSWPEWILLFRTIGSEFNLTQIPAIAFSKMSFSSIIPTKF